MGQKNNSGRNATLDNKKVRAAGRDGQRHDQIDRPAKGKAAGAFGADSKANRRGGVQTQGAGGGGGGPTGVKNNHLTTGRSTKPARKRKA
jgi:hypothetical protein